MASESRNAFDNNCSDIDRLLSVHKELGGSGPGRKYGVEVLNKSSVVLLCAFWEAYCEDLAAEALKVLVDHAASYEALSVPLRRAIARELKADHHELAVWRLAGDGWRGHLSDRLDELQAERNRRLNTPKADYIDDMFNSALGIERVSDAWYWSGMSRENARTKLDEFVSLRGDVAHRGTASRSIRKSTVRGHYNHIKRLVERTGGRVSKEVKSATGISLIKGR